MNDKGKRLTALAMDLLIREILFSFFRLNATGERLFAGIGQTPGKVSLMRSLMEQGPQSVAQIARARRSRDRRCSGWRMSLRSRD